MSLHTLKSDSVSIITAIEVWILCHDLIVCQPLASLTTHLLYIVASAIDGAEIRDYIDVLKTMLYQKLWPDLRNEQKALDQYSWALATLGKA